MTLKKLGASPSSRFSPSLAASLAAFAAAVAFLHQKYNWHQSLPFIFLDVQKAGP